VTGAAAWMRQRSRGPLEARVKGFPPSGLEALGQASSARELVAARSSPRQRMEELIGGHGRRVGLLAYRLARRSGLSHAQSVSIAEAGYLHDLGKIVLPDWVMVKSERLNDSERQIVETHPGSGFTLLSQFGALLRLDFSLAASVSLCHHERLDGSGYPMSLTASQIPIEAQIVAVADVFDALTSARVYKSAWSINDALEEIAAASGRRFNTGVVVQLVEAMDRGADTSQESIADAFDAFRIIDARAQRILECCAGYELGRPAEGLDQPEISPCRVPT